MRSFKELSKAEKVVIIQHAQKYYNDHTHTVINSMKIAEFYEEPGVSIRLRPDKWENYNWSWFAQQSEAYPELFMLAETSIPYYQLDQNPTNMTVLWVMMSG